MPVARNAGGLEGIRAYENMSVGVPAFSSQVADADYACIDLAPRAHAGLVVSCVGRERVLAGYRVAREGYVCHALEFVAEGEGTVILDGRKHRLQAGSVFTYGPGVAHEIESDARRPLNKYFVDYFGRDAARLEREVAMLAPTCAAVKEPEVVRQLFDGLLREGQKPHPFRPELTAAYLRLLLLKTRERLPAGLAATAASSRAYETLQRALRLIEREYATLHSLADLAAAAKVDPAHLCRLFARFRADSPQRCLMRRKLAAGARLLATEQVWVKEAAAAAGFADALHFSRRFRDAFGCSPTEFQARHRASIVSSRK